MSEWDDVSSVAPQSWDDVSAPVGDNDVQASQITGAARIPAMVGGAVATGLGKAVSTPGDLAQLYDAYIGAPTARAVSTLASQVNPNWGTPQPLDFGKVDPQTSKQLNWLLPDTSQVTHDLSAAGISNRPDLQPQNTSEKYLSAGADGLGSVLPYMMGAGIPAAVNMAAQGIGSGALDQLSQQYFPDNKYVRAAADLTGGVGGGYIGSKAGQIANAATDTSNVMQAYKDAGVTPRLTGDVSGSPAMQMTQATASKLPFGSGQVSRAADKTLNEFGNSVESVANSFGKSSTLQEAGQATQDLGNQWIKDYKANSDKNWQTVDSYIPPTMPTSLNNTANTLLSIKKAAGGNSAAEDFLSSGLVKSVDNIFTQGAKNNQPIQWNTLSAVRSRVGEYLSDPQSISDAGHAQAKQLYGAITKDMQSTALSQGPDALKAFQDANAYTYQGHNFIDGTLSDLLKKDPENAAKSLLSSAANGGTKLQALRQNIPQATDELAAASLRRVNDSNVSKPNAWLSNMDDNRKMSPEAYNALYADPDAQKRMSALSTVAQTMKNTDKFVNHSNSGTHLGTIAAYSAPIEGAMGGYATGGLHGAALGFGMGTVPLALGGIAGAASTNVPLMRMLSATAPRASMAPTLFNTAANQIPFSLAPSQ